MAEGEILATLGNEVGCRQAIDAAERLLPRDAADPDMPFLVLGDVHLARWRSHCLARLGASEAVDDPTAALRPMGKNFARAEAGLRCDLAPAHLVCGEREEACRQARETASSPRRPDLHASNAGSPSYSPCDTAATCPIAST